MCKTPEAVFKEKRRVWNPMLGLIRASPYLIDDSREMEVPPSGILSLSAPRRRGRTSHLQDYRVQEYKLPSPPAFNVLRESLSVESQNIPCATLKIRGSWVISVYLRTTPKSSFPAQLHRKRGGMGKLSPSGGGGGAKLQKKKN